MKEFSRLIVEDIVVPKVHMNDVHAYTPMTTEKFLERPSSSGRRSWEGTCSGNPGDERVRRVLWVPRPTSSFIDKELSERMRGGGG